MTTTVYKSIGVRIQQLKRYPFYKDSDLEWLGEIPAHWKVRRLKYSADIVIGKVDSEDSNLPYTGLEHIESWSGKRIALNGGTSSDGQANLYQPGDVLFGKLRPYLAKVHAADAVGSCTSELLVIRPKVVHQRFLMYYLLNPAFIGIVDSSTYGAKMPRANWEFIGNLPMLIPPNNEQHAIGAFLDRETSKIDTLIAKKQNLIEKLKEKRTALISRTVTRGLPPDTAKAAGLEPYPKLRPSGIDWLGDIPEHWNVSRFRRMIQRIDQGWSPIASNDQATDDEYGVLKLSAISNGQFRPEYNKVFDDWSDDLCNLTPQDGDLLISRSNTPDLVGDACIVKQDFPNRILPDLIYRVKVRPKVAFAEFVCWFLLSEQSRAQIKMDARGSSGSMVKLGQVHIRSWHVPMPPLPEQKAIANYLDRETSKIDRMIEKVEVAIEKLLEYRSALITATVTGKIDIRESAGKDLATTNARDSARID